MNGIKGNQGKRVLVTITPYNEQEKRTNGGVVNACPPPPPLPLPTSPIKSKEDAVEMQSIESFKLKETPSPVIPKPPQTYFSPTSSPTTTTPPNGSPRHLVGIKQSQTNGNFGITINNKCQVAMDKKNLVKIHNSNKLVANGKVAVKIGAYEGETKQPSRLEFLPQGRSTTDSPVKPGCTEEVTNGPVVSRLQNELVATLQRSNLRKKTEEENSAAPLPSSKPPTTTSPTTDRPVTLLQSNVEKLAAAIANRVTIKVSPENGTR